MIAAASLVALMMSSLDRYLETGRSVGCPADQMRNLSVARVVLQPRQLAFAAAARACDAPGGPDEVGFGGARMGGKSHTLLSVMGADDCMRHPGLKCLLLRKVGVSAREGFESLLPKTIAPLGRYVPSEGMFRFDNGSWIRLGHFQREADVDKYLGLEYDAVAIEEATTLSKSKVQAIRSCCRSPEGSGWRARKYYSTNPGGVGHAWFKAAFLTPYRRGAETTTRFVPATVADNAFASAEYRQFLDGLSGWLRRAWRDGDWDIAAGQFFTNFRSDLVCRELPELPTHWRVWLGLDYGFTHHTCAYLMAESGDGDLWVVDEHAERRWLPGRHVAAVRAMCARHGVAPWRPEGAYAGRDVFNRGRDGKTIADDYAALGLPLVAADDDRVNGAAEVLRRLGDADADPPQPPTVFITPRCPRLLECLPALEHDPHRPEDVLKVDCDDDGGGGDDYYDAFRYACMHAGRWSGAPAACDERDLMAAGVGW